MVAGLGSSAFCGRTKRHISLHKEYGNMTEDARALAAGFDLRRLAPNLCRPIRPIVHQENEPVESACRTAPIS